MPNAPAAPHGTPRHPTAPRAPTELASFRTPLRMPQRRGRSVADQPAPPVAQQGGQQFGPVQQRAVLRTEDRGQVAADAAIDRQAKRRNSLQIGLRHCLPGRRAPPAGQCRTGGRRGQQRRGSGGVRPPARPLAGPDGHEDAGDRRAAGDACHPTVAGTIFGADPGDDGQCFRRRPRPLPGRRHERAHRQTGGAERALRHDPAVAVESSSPTRL